jgi:hypothetical protein
MEIWLSILVRKLLKQGSFTSAQDLQAKVFAFIDYYNRTMATPFKWTYQGKALTVYTTGGFPPECTSHFGKSWQRLAFDVGQHTYTNLKCFRAADIWKQVQVALTILIDKGDSWNGLSCLAHASSLPSRKHTIFSTLVYPI